MTTVYVWEDRLPLKGDILLVNSGPKVWVAYDPETDKSFLNGDITVLLAWLEPMLGLKRGQYTTEEVRARPQTYKFS